MLALSIRQPYAELILRGIKTIEYRSRATRIVGERFYIYAAGKWKPRPASNPIVADNISVATDVPPWLVELANGLRLFPHALPTGVIVASAVIDRVERGRSDLYEWHLRDVQPVTHRKPSRQPQPTWFKPF
jgi:hypothetical protein